MRRLLLLAIPACACLAPGCGIISWLRGDNVAQEAAVPSPEQLPDDVPALLAAADRAQARGTATGARSAVVALTKARGLAPEDPEVTWREARSQFWLSQYGPQDAQLAAAQAALEAAEEMVRRRPDRAEGHYFRGAALGVIAAADPGKGLTTLTDEVLPALERAAELDERNLQAAARRALGAIYLKAPSYPAGPGDLDAALENLERACRLAPGWPENHLFLAEALYADHDLAAAKRAARRTVSLLKDAPGQDAALWRSRAKSLLRQIRETRHRGRDSTNF